MARKIIKEPIVDATPETKEKKKKLKRMSKDANGFRRFKINQKARELGDGVRDTWSSLTLKDKEELILAWNINGGVIAAKRYSRAELCRILGLSHATIEKIVNNANKSFELLFREKSQMKNTVFAVAGKVIHQLQDNRARAVLHTEVLDEEIAILRSQIHEVRKRKVVERKDVLAKEAEISHLLGQFRSISYQKLESLRIMLECTEGHNRFLAMFSSQKKGGIGEDSEDDNPRNGEYLDEKAIISLLEDRGENPLPTHKSVKINAGPRNPNLGFEDLQGLDPNANQQKTHSD